MGKYRRMKVKDLGFSGPLKNHDVVLGSSKETDLADGLLMDVTQHVAESVGEYLATAFGGRPVAVTKKLWGCCTAGTIEECGENVLGIILVAILRLINAQRAEKHPHVTAKFHAAIQRGSLHRRVVDLEIKCSASGVTIGLPGELTEY